MKRITAIIDEERVLLMRKYNLKDKFDLFDSFRFHGKWDKGVYFMMADISEEQFKHAIQLYKKQELVATKEYLELITGRNFETESGQENPYGPDRKPEYGPEKEGDKN